MGKTTRRQVLKGGAGGVLAAAALGAGASPAYAQGRRGGDQHRPAIPMAVLDTFSRSTATPPPGFEVSFEGEFTSIIGTEVVSGTSRMDVHFMTSDCVECKFTWVSSVGTLVVRSVCVLSDGHGTWHIARGTGRYKHFKGIGTETFGTLSPGGAFTNFERFAGIVTNDEDGDKD